MFQTAIHSKQRNNMFGLEFTEQASANNWATRTVDNFKTIVLPKTFEELQQVPLDRSLNFLMSMDKILVPRKFQFCV